MAFVPKPCPTAVQCACARRRGEVRHPASHLQSLRPSARHPWRGRQPFNGGGVRLQRAALFDGNPIRATFSRPIRTPVKVVSWDRSSPRAGPGLGTPHTPVETGTLLANHGAVGAQMCLRWRINAPARPRSLRVSPLSKKPCGRQGRSAGGDPSRVTALRDGRPSLLGVLGARPLLGKFSRGRCDSLLGFGESRRGAPHLRDECV